MYLRFEKKNKKIRDKLIELGKVPELVKLYEEPPREKFRKRE